MRHRIKIFFSIVFVLFALTGRSAYASSVEDRETGKSEDHAKFDPGPFILEHIGDSYYWHILHIGNFELSIPLPVIVYSNYTGLNIFMSSKFHHGKEAYKGFYIAKEGSNKGKIVENVSENISEVPLDLSITKNVLSLFISLTILLWLFVSIANRYKRNPDKAPKGVQSALEPLILFIRDDIAKPSIGEKKYERYMPFLLTVFFFIFLNNLMGLIPIFPGGANLTGNIAVTMVLALFTFAITTFSGNRNYWQHLVNPPGVPWWLKMPLPLIPLIEITGMFIKPFVLLVRLFANITAGHIIALGFFSLIFIFGNINTFAGYSVAPLTLVFTIFMTVLELLVAFIQAYVFTLLSALYFGMATEEHHH